MKLKKLFFLSVVFISCNPADDAKKTAPQTATDSVSVIANPVSISAAQATSFSEIDSSGILMFPLALTEKEEDENSSLLYKSSGRSIKYWNIVFYNSNTGLYYTLGNKKMLITNYDVKYSSRSFTTTDGINTSKNYIFYNIISTDYNKDNKLTYDDPNYLYISDKEGKNLKQISPDGYTVKNWQWIKKTGKIIMVVTPDSDKNNKFNDKDETTVFQINPVTDTIPVELFSNDFKNSLKVLHSKNWNQ